MKHTQGQWKAVCVGNMDNGQKVFEVHAGIGDVIAEYTAEHDARLIAAAPDLLEALRDTLAALVIAYEFEGDVFGVHHNDTQDAMETARAAIARATS